MLKSLMAKIKAVLMLAPVTVTATGASAAIDLAGFDSCMILVNAGTMAFDGSNLLDLKVEHSDDNSAFVATAAADIFEGEDMANGIAKKLDAAGDASAVHAIFYTGSKRYIKLAYTETGTVSVILGVSAIKGHPRAQPQY